MAYDLTEYANQNPEISAQWIKESREFCTVDGKLICVPLTVIRPIGLYYNEALYKPEKFNRLTLEILIQVIFVVRAKI